MKGRLGLLKSLIHRLSQLRSLSRGAGDPSANTYQSGRVGFESSRAATDASRPERDDFLHILSIIIGSMFFSIEGCLIKPVVVTGFQSEACLCQGILENM